MEEGQGLLIRKTGWLVCCFCFYLFASCSFNKQKCASLGFTLDPPTTLPGLLRAVPRSVCFYKLCVSGEIKRHCRFPSKDSRIVFVPPFLHRTWKIFSLLSKYFFQTLMALPCSFLNFFFPPFLNVLVHCGNKTLIRTQSMPTIVGGLQASCCMSCPINITNWQAGL